MHIDIAPFSDQFHDSVIAITSRCAFRCFANRHGPHCGLALDGGHKVLLCEDGSQRLDTVQRSANVRAPACFLASMLTYPDSATIPCSKGQKPSTPLRIKGLHVLVVQYGRGFKLCLATGEYCCGCLSPVCGVRLFWIVKVWLPSVSIIPTY